MITMRQNIIKNLLWMILGIPVVFSTACSLNTDVHFYRDQSWQADAKFKYYDTLTDSTNLVIDLVNEVLQANGLETVVNLPTGLEEKPFVEALLREMVAHYGTKQIDAGWELISEDPVDGTVYSLRASGRSWESFEDLIPGYITVEPGSNNETLKIVMEFSQENVLASAIIQETIRIHGSEIISSNAPVERNGYAQWPNPERIEIELVPESTMARFLNQVPWSTVIIIIIILILITAGYLGYRYYVYG